MDIAIHWFRRDLRLEDNAALSAATSSGLPVLPLFIFDEEILKHLPRNDARVNFLYESLEKMNKELKEQGSSILIEHGNPLQIWGDLLKKFSVKVVHTNRDYEPYALERDQQVKELLLKNGVEFQTYKDQVIFEKSEIVKDDGTPYSIFTPFKRKWIEAFEESMLEEYPVRIDQLTKINHHFPTLKDLGLEESEIHVPEYSLRRVAEYDTIRDLPAVDGTSHLSPHLRFGTVSVRQIISRLNGSHQSFLSELIWREFFMHILFHHPRVVNENFNRKYNGIQWRNDEKEFEKWCKGQTGYPMVDAGMRELNQTGFMHNRVRMVTASFLCKHLLIDWRWGEAYFAEKLLDFELSSNNGNWQWAAGTGCDAAPYFRVFNPESQQKKFDGQGEYIRRWVPEIDGFGYPDPMVDHKMARERAIATYKEGITN